MFPTLRYSGGRGWLRARASWRVERKNSWQMAEYLGAVNPYAVQHFLGRSNWNADAVRNEILRYSREHLIGAKENGVLIVDETGFLERFNQLCGNLILDRLRSLA